MAPLAGKKVLIIGGTSGIGFGVAKAALAEGAHVIVASSDVTKVEAAVQRLGNGERAQGHTVDVSSEESVDALFAKIGKVEHLVFTAGSTLPGGLPPMFPNIEISSARQLFDVRYWGVVLAAKMAAKGLITESLTCTSGSVDLDPLPKFSAIAGMSGALAAMTRGLALDIAPVRANCIASGLVDTEMHQRMPEAVRQQFFKNAEETTPVKHVGTPEEMAEAYLFTMKCSYVTGQTIYVDGGAMFV